MKRFVMFATVLALGMSCWAVEPTENNQEDRIVSSSHQFSPDITLREEPLNLVVGAQGNQNKSFAAFGMKSLEYLIKLASKQLQGTLTSTSTQLFTQSVTYVKTKFQRPHSKWQRAVENERTYSRKFSMRQEINDFYEGSSALSAYDPANIKFSGFKFVDSVILHTQGGKVHKVLAMGIYCSMREDSIGIRNILNHRKFSMQVDSVIVRPSLCHLPNDSLTADMAKYRIPFDFKKRKNWSATLSVDITATWMNKDSQWFTDQSMGHFNVSVVIPDSTCLDSTGVFVWRLQEVEKGKGAVSISGESFLIPRSYIGIDLVPSAQNPEESILQAADVWGTGEYKMSMQMSESCLINPEYYANEEVWKQEWKNCYKPRRPKTHFWKTLYNDAIDDYTGSKWQTIILDPMITYFQEEQSTYLTERWQIWEDHYIEKMKDNE